MWLKSRDSGLVKKLVSTTLLLNALAVNAQQQCLAYPLAEVGLLIGGVKITDPLAALQIKCTEILPGASIVGYRNLTTPTRADPYASIIANCYHGVVNAWPESPLCVPSPNIDYWCGGQDGTTNALVAVSINGAFCDGEYLGTGQYCGNGDGYQRCFSSIDDKNISKAPCVGNPINTSSGNKHQEEKDIAQSTSLIGFTRIYNSKPGVGASRTYASDMGTNWRHTYSAKILFVGQPNAVVLRPSGQNLQFYRDLTDGTWKTSADVNYIFKDIVGAGGALMGYVGQDLEAGTIESFDLSGNLLQIGRPNGRAINISYDSNGIAALADSFGRTTNFQVVSGLIRQINDAAGNIYSYQYDTDRNLTQATFPDGKSKQYAYGESPYVGGVAQTSALTGIFEEIATSQYTRFATFNYEASGKAISTEHAGGVDKYSVNYASKVVTTPQGTQTTQSFGNYLGAIKLTAQTQPAGSGCAASASTLTYDVNGNITSEIDFNNNNMCRTFDLGRNLELARVEGAQPPDNCSVLTQINASIPVGSRKVSTQWHPNWRVETKVAEPGKVTTSVYNGQPDPFNGNAVASCAPSTALLPDGSPIAVLCKRVEQATTDANGAQGFSAASQPGVANRQWTWTYNSYGQTLTAKGPRTDVNDTTTYVYYPDATADHSKGDLQTMTNPLGQVTTYGKYNKHGQVLETTDPNGVLTVNSYDLRQRLLSTSVGGQTTGYTYDAVGQVTRVTQPDASFVSYTYDPAHRLTLVADSKGNQIEYTLDNAGNRVAENVKDPAGVLTRTLSRSFDALNRVQQTTGRE